MSDTYKTSVFTKLKDNVYITKNGRIEKCRKIDKGLPCSRHYPANSLKFKHLYAQQRVLEKLTPFERNLMKLFSLISRTPTGKLKQEYSKIVAQYAIEGVRVPTEEEVKGLQRIFLELAEESPDVSENKIKKWFKNFVLGKDFTSAGFWAARDMLKRTLMRAKNFFAGGILASTLFVTSCAPGVATQGTQQEQVVTLDEYEEVEDTVNIKEQPHVFNQEFYDQLFRERSPDAINNNSFEGFSSWRTLAQNFKVESVEFIEDDLGEYSRYRVGLHEEYLDLIPMEYYDGSPITEFSQEDIKDAVRFYADYALNEYIDSPALDNPSQWDSWWETSGSNYFTKNGQEYVESIKQEYVHGRVIGEENDSELGYYAIFATTPMVHVLQQNHSSGAGWVTPTMRDGTSRVINKKISDLTFEKVGNNRIMIAGTVGAISRLEYDSYWKEHEHVGSETLEIEMYWNDNMPLGQTWRDNYGTGKELLKPEISYLYTVLIKENGSWKIDGMGYNGGVESEEGILIGYDKVEFGYSKDTFEEWRYERFIE
jgi:hypothetical protein